MLATAATTLMTLLLAGAQEGPDEAKSIGIRMVQIPSGRFTMGMESAALPDEWLVGPGDTMTKRPANGDWDESPAHEVVITRPFLMSETEVTIEQFRKFRPAYRGNPAHAPYASVISWDQAVAFCRWLSKKEGRTYRLPTEAEWEYACRAGTKTPFPAGPRPPRPEEANPWGLKNMQTGVLEWVNDWHGPYPAARQTDPVGPATGYVKVVRGGGFDYRRVREGTNQTVYPAHSPYFARASNRASMAPSFTPSPVAVATGKGPGRHEIGFRVVQAEMSNTLPLPVEPPLTHTAVKQTAPGLDRGPDMTRPYYRTRPVFLSLGQDVSMWEVGWKLGIPRGIGVKYHNTALGFMPNGDFLAADYNSPRGENDPDQSILTLRRRFGAEEWDVPSPWPDFADAADAAPVFWNDRGKVWLFFGSPRLIGNYPFQYLTSDDSGASWSPVIFPRFDEAVGAFTAQPINSVVRAADGTIYLPVDGSGRNSVLFASRDNGAHWRDTGGRTGGRHTSLVLGHDGSLLGFGGKNTDIDGFMPLSTSRDGGKSYQLSKLPFSTLNSGQRPSVIRLRNGHLFFVGDTYSSKQRTEKKNTAIAAVSQDEGKTWHLRQLEGGNTLGEDGKPVLVRTVGYTTATQEPNGVIHIITSHNRPELEIELNEAWVLSRETAVAPAVVKLQAGSVKAYREDYPDGTPRVTWSAGTGEDGRYLLDGVQLFYYAGGRKHWEATFAAGRRVGLETYWRPSGDKAWEKLHRDDGTWTWKVWNERGGLTAVSEWRGPNRVKYDLLDERPAEK